MTDRDAIRFWSKVKIGGDGCWMWEARRNHCGYGTFKVGTKSVLAHRAAYAIAFGEIPPGSNVCHSCDVPACVNPSHLWIGSQQENVQDMVAKGRVQCGERSGRSKLTEQAVRDIRDSYASRRELQGELAKKYGVDPSIVSLVVRRKIWRHVA